MWVWLVVKVDFMSDVFQFGDFEPPKILGRISIKYSKISYFNHNIIIFNSWYSRIFTCTDRVSGREVKLAPKNAKETAFESSQLWIFKQPQTMVTYFGGPKQPFGHDTKWDNSPTVATFVFSPSRRMRTATPQWWRRPPGAMSGSLEGKHGDVEKPWVLNGKMIYIHGNSWWVKTC